MNVTTSDDEFVRIWQAHYSTVLAYARRRVGEPAAEEVTVEAFSRAWRNPASLEGDVRLWLLSAARGAIANRRRAERRRGALLTRLQHQPIEVAPDPAQQVGDDHAMRAAFAALSARDRETLALVAWDGLAPAAAAEVVGCSPATFSVRLFRARRRLEQALADQTGDQPPAAAVVEGTQ